jgi:hypothetical protein
VKGGHGHLTIEKATSHGEYSIELNLVTGDHGRIPKGALSVEKSFDRVMPFLTKPADSLQALISASFSMYLKEWEPTVSLPFSPVGITEQMPGLPRISGLDFTFDEQSDSQHLHRAFVTTYDGIDRMVVRMLLSLQTVWAVSMITDTIELVRAHLPILARKRANPKSPRE